MLMMNSYTCILIFCSFVYCEGQLVGSNSNSSTVTQHTFPKLPKCCNDHENYNTSSRKCEFTSPEPVYEHWYFPSNTTHINSDKVAFLPTFYHAFPNCSLIYLEKDDFLGFIFNGSVIMLDPDDMLLEPSKYCVDFRKSGTVIYICIGNITDTTIYTGQFYFPCLIVSTACYFISAIVYMFILNVKEVHKKCFIGYTLTMGSTFFILILLQKLNTGCVILGSLFFVFILSAFVWLLCLCLDMVYLCRNFRKEEAKERFLIYLAASIMIPCIMLTISIIPSEIPDVPNSFLKGRGMCSIKPAPRIAIIFVPMGLLLLGSIGSLIYTFCTIRLNEKQFTTEIRWLEKKSMLKYMTRSYLLIWLFSFIWVVDSAIENTPLGGTLGNMIVYEILEGSQGIFVIAVFVLNRYTRRDLHKTLFGRQKDPNHASRVNKLLEKLKNDAPCPENSADSSSEAEP